MHKATSYAKNLLDLLYICQTNDFKWHGKIPAFTSRDGFREGQRGPALDHLQKIFSVTTITFISVTKQNKQKVSDTFQY